MAVRENPRVLRPDVDEGPPQVEGVDIGARIGEGVFSSVYAAVWKTTDVAVKHMRTLGIEGEGVSVAVLRELSVLKTYRHPRIVNMLHSVVRRDSTCLIFELAKYDLSKVIKECMPLELGIRKTWMRHIIEGMAYLHNNKVLHRDIKPQNILIFGDGTARIADFSLARAFKMAESECPYTPGMVTLWYRPPEMLLPGVDYDESCDVWSVGCVLFELMTYTILFRAESDSEISQLKRIIQVCGQPDSLEWPRFREVLPLEAKRLPKSPLLKFHEFLAQHNMGEVGIRFVCMSIRLTPAYRRRFVELLQAEYLSYDNSCPPVSTTRIALRLFKPVGAPAPKRRRLQYGI